MSIQMHSENGGMVFVVKLIGTLVKEDYKPLVLEFSRLVKEHGKLSVLLDMTRFEGWDAAGLWQEIKFDTQHTNEMKRLAVVGEKRWQHAIATFAKPFTPAEVRYFEADAAPAAMEWVAEK
jgi:SpoIIAA-like